MNDLDDRLLDQKSYAFRELIGQRPLGFPIGDGNIYFVTGVPNNAIGVNGDVAFRKDGVAGANTVLYHKEAAVWVACTL